MNDALFLGSGWESGEFSRYKGQTDKYLTKLLYKLVGAPNAASFKHLYSFGSKSFLIETVAQHSG